MDEVLSALEWRWPEAVIQFEDFSNEHAFGLLNKYQEKFLCFNDDIQGTAAVVLAGLLGALRIQKINPSAECLALGDSPKSKLRDQKVAFLGAGSAGAGVADLIAEAMAIEAKAVGVATCAKTGKELDVSYFRKNNLLL